MPDKKKQYKNYKHIGYLQLPFCSCTVVEIVAMFTTLSFVTYAHVTCKVQYERLLIPRLSQDMTPGELRVYR